MTRLIDLLWLSRRVAADGAREPEVTRAAIAWIHLNRVREAAGHLRRHGRAHPAFGDGTLRDSLLRHGGLPPAGTGFADQASCRALATVCLVSCRDLADPARGATRYHHHREMPAWSARLSPVAILGSYLFYRG